MPEVRQARWLRLGGSDVMAAGLRGRAVRAGAGAGLGWLIPLIGLAACSPVLDWRELHPEGWGLVASLPCRPNYQARQVPLAGNIVSLEMMLCRTDDHTFALSTAAMSDPTQVGPALAALLAAAQANVGGRITSEQAAKVAGMTPQPGARRRQLVGQLPDGQPIHEQVLVFAHGLRVFQATLVGPQADEARATPFFDSMMLAP